MEAWTSAYACTGAVPCISTGHVAIPVAVRFLQVGQQGEPKL